MSVDLTSNQVLARSVAQVISIASQLRESAGGAINLSGRSITLVFWIPSNPLPISLNRFSTVYPG